jgi:ABC-type antimicrobial peptide transport system permease subunit
MRAQTLRTRSLRHYWRTNAAVVLGVATAVAVLAGSLLVGESVRASLKHLALSRLGQASEALTSPRFFREQLAADLTKQPAFAERYGQAGPLLALKGSVSRPDGGELAGDIFVYGVDARFFTLHGVEPPALGDRNALLSPALHDELQPKEGDSLLVLVEATSDIPSSTLFGRRDEPAKRLRVTSAGTLAREKLGEFTLRPTPQELRAVFLPLNTLQKTLGLDGRVNTLIVSDKSPAVDNARPSNLASLLAKSAQLEDLGLKLRELPARNALALESPSGLITDDAVAKALGTARDKNLEARPSLVYLANAIRAKGKEVPYSLVAAIEPERMPGLAPKLAIEKGSNDPPPIVLNDWAANDLGTKAGDTVTLDYYLWMEDGRLLTKSADFKATGTVPLAGDAADPDLVPAYPGITETLHMSNWDPPFPVDLKRIRPRDEEYWARHRTTPKAFVLLAAGQKLWGHRLGKVTSMRLIPQQGTDLTEAATSYAAALVPKLLEGDTEQRLQAFSLEVTPVRQQAMAASRGTTDFGTYFVYFSFFLVAAALLLAGLFFRLGVEQRLREVGLLRALGFTPARLRAQLLGEGLVLATLGAVLGVLGAVAYAGLMMLGLQTIWVGAVGTRELELVISWKALAAGATGGIAAAAIAIAWTLRDLRRRSPRALLAGTLEDWTPAKRRGFILPAALAATAAALLIAAAAGAMSATPAFFAGGTLLLIAALATIRQILRGRPKDPAAIHSVAGLGARGASFRPGRSLVAIALVAAATFVIVAVGAFRRDTDSDLRKPDSESGGFTLLALSSQPLHHDPRTPEGRAALGLPKGALDGVTLARFRRSGGEDASCLNLYRPSRPTILGAEPSFLQQNRFAFQNSLASTEAERANPWLLLERDAENGTIPVVADGTTLEYVLARKLGDEMTLGDTGVRVRFVAALKPGLLQSELITGDRHFQRAFPDEHGYRFFLLDAPPSREADLSARLESSLSDFGFDVTDAATRLNAYHRVENTYIATFQTLGALGLLLGTVGLAAVLLRNAFERRRELALLQAIGYRQRQLSRILSVENALLLGVGLAGGAIPAILSILPALGQRGTKLPLLLLGSALTATLLFLGALVSGMGAAVIRRQPLLGTLRSE